MDATDAGAVNAENVRSYFRIQEQFRELFPERTVVDSRPRLGVMTVRHRDFNMPQEEGWSTFFLPPRLTASVVPENPRFPLVELEVVHLLDATAEPPRIFSGPPQLASVTYRRRPERELLAAKDVRLPPIGRYMAWALELAAFRECRHGEGCAFLFAVHPDEHGNHWLRMSSPPIDGCQESHENGAYPPELVARFLDEFRLKQSGVTEHRRYTAITPERLQRVASVYRGGGSRPTKAVMDHWNIERATASRWVKQARARGFLGPARERRSGEF